MIDDFSQLLKRAASGDEGATNSILIYFSEHAVSAEEQEQAHLYLKQASRESHYAIYLRGLLFEFGYGVKSDLDMSFLLMREAASKGNAKATYEVARYFLDGYGIPQNYENAFQWLSIAADSPNYIPDAMYELGRMYEQGLGVMVDFVKAKEWYEKAAKKGHRSAQKKIEQMQI